MNKEIKQAYDKMNPRPDAENRMLDQILESLETEVVRPHGDKSFDSKIIKFENQSSQQRKSPRKTLSSKALPLVLAACLVLLVGVGIFATLTTDSLKIISSDMQSPSSSSESVSEELREGDKNLGTMLSDSSNEGLDFEDSLSASDISATDSGEGLTNPAIEYPLIIQDSLGELRIQEGLGSVDSSNLEGLIGSEIGSAVATTREGDKNTTCIVYEYLSVDEGLYLISYSNDDRYYFAARL